MALRKMFLSTKVPEVATFVPRQYPDIVQKLDAFRKEKEEYKHPAPTLRPNPLEKYDRRAGPPADDNEIDAEAREEELDNLANERDINNSLDQTTEVNYEELIESLPSYVRAKARRLYPYLLDKDIGDLEMSDVLYDLVAVNAKRFRSKNLNTLASVYSQLNADVHLPKSLFTIKKLPENRGASAAHTPEEAIRVGMPGRRNLPSSAPLSRNEPSSPRYHSKASTPGIGEAVIGGFPRQLFAADITTASHQSPQSSPSKREHTVSDEEVWSVLESPIKRLHLSGALSASTPIQRNPPLTEREQKSLLRKAKTARKKSSIGDTSAVPSMDSMKSQWLSEGLI